MPENPERQKLAPPRPAGRQSPPVASAPVEPPRREAAPAEPPGPAAKDAVAPPQAGPQRDVDQPISSTLPGDPGLHDLPAEEWPYEAKGGVTTDVEQFVASLPGGAGPPPEPRLSKPPPHEPMHEYVAGEMIAGKYQLERLLGEGGMGAVWLARNQALDADVAVKLIRRERATPGASQRLLQEARAAAKLGHPSIVRVFDFGESEHRDPFIVMELLNGESLRDLLSRKKQLRQSRAVRTLLPIAGALAAAHSKGIVHRDLKPENILIVQEAGVPVPKIVDFGIAKLCQDDPVTPFTQTGQIMGSPGYMSPEQLDGRSDVDLRTDIWSYSVVLYEALTGNRPFEGTHYSQMLSAILLKDAVPLTELGAGDAELWAIVSRGLAKHVSERWSSMTEMGTALARWALERGIENDITGISLAAHWLHGGEGPASDAPPSAPYAAYLEADNILSLAPKPLGRVTPNDTEPPPRAERTIPPAAESPGSPGDFGSAPAKARNSRPGAVLVVDPPPPSRRILGRPLTLLAIIGFFIGIIGTWMSLRSSGPPAPDPSSSPSAAETTSSAAVPPPSGAPSPGSIPSEDPPTPASAGTGTASPPGSEDPSPQGTSGSPTHGGAQPTSTSQKRILGKKPGSAQSAMPLPKRPNF